ncbi:hypothetical protein [Candidatus Galacturonibacter soehngenii]|uniref:Uncharacterized protein n=1 Tax=Candidatus Galacturonatibacter soehngenii TaxID=2307010 RepID=A0A7V7UF65_9FIRM|nr:hypothetical protein [Candidatus Galacturonibacter soehngenii]KAB1435914.1 hypothetical protein F7O84_16190 [Candidatus Galacturonibacter soehngenii]
MGGIVVAVIQNSIIFRNIKVRADRYNDIEKVLKILEILIGGVLIILPHINILSRYFLVQSNTIICVLCYSIYAFWGVEKILFSSFNLYFNKKKSKKMK